MLQNKEYLSKFCGFTTCRCKNLWGAGYVDMDSFRVRFKDGIMKFIIPRKKDSKKEKIQGVIRREVSFF